VGSYHKYTAEENEYLQIKWLTTASEDLVIIFNEKFNVGLSLCALKTHCLRLFGAKKCRTNRNGWVRPKRSRFNIGDETFEKYTWVKVNNDNEDPRLGKYKSRNWEKKHFIVWRSANGGIPDGHVIIFLDQNRHNCDLENLYCVTLEIRAIMAKNRWFSTDPVATLTAIKYCELLYAIRRR